MSFNLLSFLDIFSRDNLNPLSANPTKWSNTLKQFVGNLPPNSLSVFDHFVRVLKGLRCYGCLSIRFFFTDDLQFLIFSAEIDINDIRTR